MAEDARLCTADDDSVIHPHQLLRTIYEMAGDDGSSPPMSAGTSFGPHSITAQKIRHFSRQAGLVRWAWPRRCDGAQVAFSRLAGYPYHRRRFDPYEPERAV